MLNLPLLRSTIKFNYVIWLIFMFILVMYFSIIISMSDPSTKDSMDALLASLPPQLVDAMNFKTVDSTLLGFIAGYFYGFLILLFPLIYSVIMADRMIARYVDSGSMAFLLSTPTKRANVALTQAVFLLGSLLLLLIAVAMVGVGISQALFPGELEIGKFISLNIGAILLYFALSGVGFFASCLFNESKFSLAFGGGIPVAFFLIKMLSAVAEPLSGLKYLSLMTLFDPNEIIAGSSSVLLMFAAMAIIGLVLYAAGIFVFSKKDLPL